MPTLINNSEIYFNTEILGNEGTCNQIKKSPITPDK